MSKASYQVSTLPATTLQNVVDVQSGPYPWLRLELTVGEEQATVLADPAKFYTLARAGIKTMIVGNDDPEATPEQKRVKQLVKTAIKGLFLTLGGKILDMLFLSNDHPRPQKGDDLIEWYSNIFAQIILTKCSDGVLVLKAGGQFGKDRIIIIDEICTFGSSESQPGTEGRESTREGASPASPCTECDQ